MMNSESSGGDRMPSDPIASEKVMIERKIFFLDLKENQRGRFLKITEDVGGRRDTIMLPAPAFRDFLEALQRLVEFESKLEERPRTWGAESRSPPRPGRCPSPRATRGRSPRPHRAASARLLQSAPLP